MKNYSLSVSRAVSQVIMQVHKPTVAFKLALQLKPILSYYYKNRHKKTVNNLTRINWKTRLIIASNKSRHIF